MINTTYLCWMVMAIEIVIVVSVCIAVVNLIFYKERMLRLLIRGRSMIKRKG